MLKIHSTEINPKIYSEIEGRFQSFWPLPWSGAGGRGSGTVSTAFPAQRMEGCGMLSIGTHSIGDKCREGNHNRTVPLIHNHQKKTSLNERMWQY